MLAMMLVVMLGQAPVEGVWVVATKRQGVSSNSAAELIAAVDVRLASFPRAAPVADLTACKGKLLCLLAAAKKQHAAFLVAVETARVVGQLIVKVSLLNVEEDGRAVVSKLIEGPAMKVTADLGAFLDSAVVPALRQSFPAPAVVVTPLPPSPEVTPPSPPADVAPVVVPPAANPEATTLQSSPAAPPEPHGLRTTGLVVGAVGVAGLAASAVLGGLTLDAVSRRDRACSPGQQCNDPVALGLHDRAALTQDLGIVIAAASGALLVTGAVLFLAGAPSQPRLAIVPGPHGPAFFVSASF